MSALWKWNTSGLYNLMRLRGTWKRFRPTPPRWPSDAPFRASRKPRRAYNSCVRRLPRHYPKDFQGRHPVIETPKAALCPMMLALTDTERIILLTGPNMAGKSTYLRQTALIGHFGANGEFPYLPKRPPSVSWIEIFYRASAPRMTPALAKAPLRWSVPKRPTCCLNATARSPDYPR